MKIILPRPTAQKYRYVISGKQLNEQIVYTNLLETFNLANQKEINEGLIWYNTAHEKLVEIAKLYNFSTSKVCAICAVISPLQRWHKNLENTELALRRYNITGYAEGHMFSNFNWKATDILNKPETDIPQILNVKNAPKTYNFWLNLSQPNNFNSCTIDSFMGMAAIGLYNYSCSLKVNISAYRIVERQMCEVAKEIELLPHQTQAIIWNVAHRENEGRTTDIQRMIDVG